jgi:hypothetical protein
MSIMESAVVGILAFLVLQSPISMRPMELHAAIKAPMNWNAAVQQEGTMPNEAATPDEVTPTKQSRSVLKYTFVGVVMGGLVGAAVGVLAGNGTCFNAEEGLRASGCDDDGDTATGALIGAGFGGLCGFLIGVAE